MTRMRRISADLFFLIRENLPHPRHPRSYFQHLRFVRMIRLFLPQSQIGNEQVSLRVLLDDAGDRWHADYLFRPGGEPEQGYFGCRSSLTRKRAATGSAEIEHLFWNINRVIATDSSSIARGEIH